jgi:hypothetical protein
MVFKFRQLGYSMSIKLVGNHPYCPGTRRQLQGGGRHKTVYDSEIMRMYCPYIELPMVSEIPSRTPDRRVTVEERDEIKLKKKVQMINLRDSRADPSPITTWLIYQTMEILKPMTKKKLRCRK